MTSHTLRDPNDRPDRPPEAGAVDLSPDVIRFYVEKGRRLQSQAFTNALRSLGRRLIGRSAAQTEARPPIHAEPA